VLSSLSVPLGTIHPWIRPDNTTPLPYGWLICDGSTVVDSSSQFNGKVIPDLRGNFPRGHATLSNANFAADTLYFAGGTVPTGGTNTVNLSHSHSTPNHSHTWSDTSTVSQSFSSLPYWWGAFSENNHTHTGSGSTNNQAPTTNSQLSASNENRPAFTELVTLIRIK